MNKQDKGKGKEKKEKGERKKPTAKGQVKIRCNPSIIFVDI